MDTLSVFLIVIINDTAQHNVLYIVVNIIYCFVSVNGTVSNCVHIRCVNLCKLCKSDVCCKLLYVPSCHDSYVVGTSPKNLTHCCSCVYSCVTIKGFDFDLILFFIIWLC